MQCVCAHVRASVLLRTISLPHQRVVGMESNPLKCVTNALKHAAPVARQVRDLMCLKELHCIYADTFAQRHTHTRTSHILGHKNSRLPHDQRLRQGYAHQASSIRCTSCKQNITDKHKEAIEGWGRVNLILRLCHSDSLVSLR